MRKQRTILVILPVGSHSERMKLEGVLRYTHEKKGEIWYLELAIGGLTGKIAARCRQGDFGGVIAYVISPAQRRTLLALGLPTVLIEDLAEPKRPARRRDVVTLICDHRAEGTTAANYFLDRGYANFAFAGTERPNAWSRFRREGFERTLSARGFRPQAAPSGDLTDWLVRLPKPCAIFAVHDLRARQILSAAAEAGVAVPGDVAVLGVDDDEVMCTTTTPTLSSIPTFDQSLGYAAGRALNELIAGRARGRVIRTRHTKVTTRGSTESAASTDPLVARAIAWAREHLDRKLTAQTLAREAGCSTTYLQLRTEKALGATLGETIRRLRLSVALDLLSKTGLPVADIASQCGFRCVSHFCACVRRATGKTPLAYRAVRSLT